MKLCRFRKGEDATVRTGIYRDGSVYETRGLEAVGIHRAEDISLLAPISQPPSFRDFMAFEGHVRNTRRKFGRDSVPEEWYAAPPFFFENPASIVGPDAVIMRPPGVAELDFELEVGVVIGASGSDIPVEDADDIVLGLTIVNDWSARDVQRRESRVGLGYHKSKDFATSVGPYLVTPDELDPLSRQTDRGRVYALAAKAYINDELVAEGSLESMSWTFAEMISYASQGTRLSEGDLIASGTITGCCILEMEREYLNPGDEVLLEVQGLGALANRIA